ncbi:MAG: nicotinate-nucleotide adenylyltransferase [Candidatus Bipolaricaulaceae bacterium]
MRNRVGLFGGTFNPIHFGHLRVAEEAMRQFGLAKVVFLPTGHPPHKQVAEGVPGDLRYQMVCLAVRGRPGLTVSRHEVDKDGPSYTVDTVEAMKRRYPQGVAYIVGADIFSNIEAWKDYQRLLQSCPFVVAPRGRVSSEAFRRAVFRGAELHFLDMQEVSLSSSEIRRRYRDGRPTGGLVPPAVDAFIRAHGLYGVAGRGEAG